MALRIDDYALIGDCQSAALVGRDGSIDWLCLPRFDSGACFAALLGTPDHGRWLLAPAGQARRVSRRYRGETLVLETDFETDDGAVTVIDFMPPRTRQPDVVRTVVGRRGRVPMRMELVIRFDYGSIVPWVRHAGNGGIRAVAGPDALELHSSVPTRGERMTTVANFTVGEGERVHFDLAWHESHRPAPPPIDADRSLAETEWWWQKWAGRCKYDGPWREAVVRSLVTLKALIYAPTGGIVAAPTTSLPEWIGGVRNWDYRFCWLRDATFALDALLGGGYVDEARAWRQWLVRAVAGDPADVRIMYGLAGERRLTELELGWLPGYENSKPVRVGNAAHGQLQLDIYGEVIAMLHLARQSGLEPDENAWRVEQALAEHLETIWEQPDDGIWEVRGPRRDFTHSKVMAWVAFDRIVKSAEGFGLPGPVERWRAVRDRIHADVCQRGYDPRRNTFVQYFGGTALDASLMMIPLVGFLPPTDPRVRGTVEAIERELTTPEGFVCRYPSHEQVDGLPPGEGTFLACTFWLARNYALLGRHEEAKALFERLLALRNDVGLLSEEYDPRSNRLLGNFPQAFSHLSLVNTAISLATGDRTADARSNR